MALSAAGQALLLPPHTRSRTHSLLDHLASAVPILLLKVFIIIIPFIVVDQLLFL